MSWPWNPLKNRSFEACCVRNLCDKARPLGHTYCEIYEEILSGVVAPKILEIGTGTKAIMRKVAGPCYWPGAGARAFREHFGAEVVTVDIHRPTSEDASDEGITALTMDAYCERSVEILAKLGPFDLVIDDGTHRAEHQLAFARLYRHLVKSGGWLVVEDLAGATATELESLWGGEVLDGGLKGDDRIWFLRT